MSRALALAALLVFAAPAYALPVQYDFVSDPIYGVSGSLAFDAETDQLELVSLFIAGFGTVDFVGPLWPGNRDAYPVISIEPFLTRNGPGLDDLALTGTIEVVLVPSSYDSPYNWGCPEGTAIPDCPYSSFRWHDQFYLYGRLQIVPEPELGLMVAAGVAGLGVAGLFRWGRASICEHLQLRRG